MGAVSKNMRVYHRYLGFFLAGIMAIYSVSGIILIFRNTDFLKNEKHKIEKLAPNLNEEAIGKAIKIKNIKIIKQQGDQLIFEQGKYNAKTGVADYKVKELPYLVSKMNNFHKANTTHPLFYLNIFFGCSLMFFVLSTFWMFAPGTQIFKKGILFTAAGVIITLVLLFV
jgi:hypothetical protein